MLADAPVDSAESGASPCVRAATGSNANDRVVSHQLEPCLDDLRHHNRDLKDPLRCATRRNCVGAGRGANRVERRLARSVRQVDTLGTAHHRDVYHAADDCLIRHRDAPAVRVEVEQEGLTDVHADGRAAVGQRTSTPSLGAGDAITDPHRADSGRDGSAATRPSVLSAATAECRLPRPKHESPNDAPRIETGAASPIVAKAATHRP